MGVVCYDSSSISVVSHVCSKPSQLGERGEKSMKSMKSIKVGDNVLITKGIYQGFDGVVGQISLGDVDVELSGLGEIVSVSLTYVTLFPPKEVGEEGEHTGGSSSYYDLEVGDTTIKCLDIIEGLDMSYSEANVFKAVWRIAAAKQGKCKKGNNLFYDSEKICFFGERLMEKYKGLKREGN